MSSTRDLVASSLDFFRQELSGRLTPNADWSTGSIIWQQRSHHRLSFSLSTPPYFHNSLEDCVLVYLLLSRNRCVYPICAITTAQMHCVVCNGLSVQTANVKSVSTLFARRVPWYCVCTGPVLDLMRVDQTRWAAECRWRATEPLTIKTERHPPTCVCVQFQFHSASQKNKPKRMVYHSNEIWFSDRCSLVRFQRNPGTITISQPAGQYQYHIRFLWKPRNW